MVEALIGLLVVCVVVDVTASVILYCVRLLPIEPNFQQIITALVVLIAVLIILFRALPILGVHP